MIVEKCPLLDELGWVTHGFYGRDSLPAGNIVILPQKHTDIVLKTGEQSDENGADAHYTDQNNVMLGIRTADCAPIFLACRHSRMIAAIHAGWPGVLQNIVGKTIARMIADGAKPDRMIAAIGPCLQRDCFEVGPDLHEKFAQSFRDGLKYFLPSHDDRYQFDSIGILSEQLQTSGIKYIWHSQIDTKADPRFNSFRNRHLDPAQETARNISVISKT